jgi:hypothetical protein
MKAFTFSMPSSRSMCKLPHTPLPLKKPHPRSQLTLPSLVPSNPKSLLHTFRAACEFAQEYGILVASAEDRPFVPVSRVVLGRSVPEGVKRAFRKWVDTPYERMECVALPLNESLRATQPA